MDAAALDVALWRVDAAGGAFRRYRVPASPRQTVLDIVTWVQRHEDSGLSYRFACRVGMCGTCAMTVNGRPRWTCRTLVGAAARDGKLEVAPLANLPVVKDLACDMTEFFEKWRRAEGRFQPQPGAGPDFAVVPPAGAARQAADAGIECIGCAVCYAVCDVVAWNPDYLGPAALNRAWTLVNDVRRDAPKPVARGRGRRRLPCLPQPPVLPPALPEALEPHGLDRGPQARVGGRGAEGRAVSARAETGLWLAQRLSAAVLALCVAAHLVTIVLAVRGGLSAAEILGRTRGSAAWAAF